MSSNSYEMVYFQVKGLGNMVRVLLADQSVKYTFTPMEVSEWSDEKKADTPLGQLPIVIVNGSTKLAQSHTILRYFGRELKLMGDNNLEAAQVEMYIDQCIDVRKKFMAMIYTNYEKGLQPFLESLPQLLAVFDKKLASNKQHLVLGKLTLADYALFDLLHVLLALSSTCLDSLPNAKAFYQAFEARPKVKAFLEQPEIKAMKFTGSGHL